LTNELVPEMKKWVTRKVEGDEKAVDLQKMVWRFAQQQIESIW